MSAQSDACDSRGKKDSRAFRRSPARLSDSGNSLPRQGRSQGGWGRLLLCIAGVVFLWGFVLPGIAQLPHVQRKIVREQTLGIDPSAMFYTDLESKPLNMDDYRRLHQRRQTELEAGNDRNRP